MGQGLLSGGGGGDTGLQLVPPRLVLARLLDHTPTSTSFCTTKPRQPSGHLASSPGCRFPDISVLEDVQSQGEERRC